MNNLNALKVIIVNFIKKNLENIYFNLSMDDFFLD